MTGPVVLTKTQPQVVTKMRFRCQALGAKSFTAGVVVFRPNVAASHGGLDYY